MPTVTVERPVAKRVPIPMNADEIDTLQQLARRDQRSEAQMARIIYLAGLEQFERAGKARGRK